MIKLYPSDDDDLSTYLSGQQTWQMTIIGHDGVALTHANPEYIDRKQLLNDLMDFNTAIQGYLMALHGANLSLVPKARGCVRNLIVNLTKDKPIHLDSSLMSAMDALENAASEFNNMLNDLARRKRRNVRTQLDLDKQKLELGAKKQEAEEKLRQAEAKFAQAERTAQEVSKREEDTNRLAQAAAERWESCRQKDTELFTKQRELNAQARKSELQTQLKLANVKATTEAQVGAMRKKLQEAQSACAAADLERKAANQKSCDLADQLRTLQERLKNKKTPAHPGASRAKVSDTAAIQQRRIRALEARVQAQDAQLKKLGIVTPNRDIDRKSSTMTKNGSPQMYVDLTRSSSPASFDVMDYSPVTPRDAVQLASPRSESVTAAILASSDAAASSPTRHGKGKKRARSTFSIEPERLDDEMDEALFPMPGGIDIVQNSGDLKQITIPSTTFFPNTNNGGQACTSNCFKATSSAESGADKDSKVKNVIKRKSTLEINRKDDSTGTNSISPKHYDWLNKNNGITLGPKRRSKAW
ncbi:uncharacterized protein MEPE_06120 [Melanopsichium pennsylvanicum]|uniref:Uncharacterized protein n=2 Tax=Melanopsichium pennsylvanicum TaxID=63383 RepID=A0AAJ4XRA6_9BASI|nr:conserved hypothetical protein [Melanopsichium pennsylvanicum 4]SNX87410.1 uncharacterized protein MEPE_06120 [Melanopsichium pennsylvanicum]